MNLLAAAAISLSLKITPQVCSAPCSIKASIGIEGIDPGKDVCLGIIYEGEQDPYTRSCWPYSGRKITDVQVSNIPTGSYEVEVRAGNHRAVTSLRVIGGSPYAGRTKNPAGR